jgi:hypothetical protein
MLPCLLLSLLAPHADEPVFVARTYSGKEVRGPLASLDADAAVLGRRKVPLAEMLSLRQEGAALPELPHGEQVILASGSRFQAARVRLDDEKLTFRHPDLGGSVSAPQSAVAMIWRVAPNGSAGPEAVRRRLLAGRRTSDLVVLRNGDSLTGTVVAIGASVEVEQDGRTRAVPWEQVSAVAFSTDGAKKRPEVKGTRWRVAVAPAEDAPGGRFTVSAPTVTDGTFKATTGFGEKLAVPVERVVSLEPISTRAVSLSTLKPAKYQYFPYLDEDVMWAADGTAAGGDLRVGGSVWERGVSLRARSRIEYAASGYARFSALLASTAMRANGARRKPTSWSTASRQVNTSWHGGSRPRGSTSHWMRRRRWQSRSYPGGRGRCGPSSMWSRPGW